MTTPHASTIAVLGVLTAVLMACDSSEERGSGPSAPPSIQDSASGTREAQVTPDCSLEAPIVAANLRELRERWRRCEVPSDSDEAVDAIHLAARQGAAELVEQLLDWEVELDAADSKGRTPCMFAATPREENSRDNQDHRAAVVRLLLDSGAAPAAKDDDGRTCLHTAAWADYDAIARALIAAGADVDSQANDGETPLMAAAQSGSLSTARVLLAANADQQLRNSDGETARGLAAEPFRENFIRLLHQY